MTAIPRYHNAILTAHRLDPAANSAVGALYEGSGELIAASQRCIERTDRWHVADPARSGPRDTVGHYQPEPGGALTSVDGYIEHAIFGGHLFGPWGHLITESLSTAWAAPHLPDAPVVFAPWGRVTVPALQRRFELLRLAGWDARQLLVISADCIFGTVHVPERLVRIGDTVNANRPIARTLNVVYDRMIARTGHLESTGPVLFARPDRHRRRHPEEPGVAALLEDAGVQLLQGWTLSVTEQIAAANAAAALVGFAGSNLHNSVFAKRGTPVIEIQDHRAHQRDQLGMRSLQNSICELRDQPFRAIRGFANDRPRNAAAIAHDVTVALGEEE